MMDYLKDFVYVNKDSLKKTMVSLKENWLIIFTGLLYTFLNIIVYKIIGTLFVGPLYIISGFILAIVSSSLISNYFNLLYNIINYNRFSLEDFKSGFTPFLWKIYGVFFIAYLGQLLLSLLNNILGAGAVLLNLVIMITVVVLFNPLPEIIYLKSKNPAESIMDSIEFMKENWLNWMVSNIVLFIILYFVTGYLQFGIFNTHISFNMIFTLKNIVIYILGQIIFSFTMIYRGYLFKLLNGSTRRKRMFMNKF